MTKVWCENCGDDTVIELKAYFGMHVCNMCAENFESGRG